MLCKITNMTKYNNCGYQAIFLLPFESLSTALKVNRRVALRVPASIDLTIHALPHNHWKTFDTILHRVASDPDGANMLV